jgi:preprotein translocase subunit SecE
MALEFYKRGQGYYTRLGTALGSGLLAVLGCWALYNRLGGITTGNIVTANVKTWIQTGIPTVLFLVLGWVIFKAVNVPRYADFMIATEGEMKKVSWSTRKEIVTSTRVVIFTVLLMSILLAVVDYGFAKLFTWMHVLKIIVIGGDV